MSMRQVSSCYHITATINSSSITSLFCFVFSLQLQLNSLKQELPVHFIWGCRLNGAVNEILETPPCTGFACQTSNYAKYGALSVSPPPSGVRNPVRPAGWIKLHPRHCIHHFKSWAAMCESRKSNNAVQQVSVCTVYSYCSLSYEGNNKNRALFLMQSDLRIVRSNCSVY